MPRVGDVVVLNSGGVKMTVVEVAAEGSTGALVRRLESENARLMEALEESVKLQSHYAELLNMHDGGVRLGFADAKAWLQRIEQIKKNQPPFKKLD
jgi:hypothetical protein